MKVMIVDDEPDMRLIVGTVLRRTGGCQTVETGDPLLALDLARREQPELILMDVLMDGCDGPEVLLQLRTDPVTSNIPVIFVTGRDDATESAHLMGLGARGIIVKPISPKGLMGQIRTILGQ